jgi:phosphoserine phosphatase
VADVCGTLFREDTTIGLLRFHLRSSGFKSPKKLFLEMLVSRKSPFFYFFYLAETFLGRPLLKHIVVLLLAGESVDSVAKSARFYSAHLLSNRKIQQVWALLGESFESGQVILASASIEPIVAALACQLDSSFVSSQLAIKDGRFTGRYSSDISGRKHTAIAKKYGIGILDQIKWVVTDNYSDYSLFNYACSAFVVVNSESRKLRWMNHDVCFLEYS